MPPPLILITLDTTNPGTLDPYRTGRNLTPQLASLAAQGIVYEEARTVAPLTLPAHASMLTGLYPVRHGLRDNGLAALPPAARTLPEALSEKGYHTAAFVSAAVLGAPYGLDQGFDIYEGPSGRSAAGEHMSELSAKVTVDRAIRWLERRDPTRPFFLWVHLFDAHAPYAPQPQDLERAGGRAYLGEVLGMDREVGRLLNALRTEKALDPAWILVAGDHGESLGRHGELTHSLLCYDTTMRVPLILRPPFGSERAGTRAGNLVSVTDVAPTLLAAAGGRALREIDGFDLWSAPDPTRGVYMESLNGFLAFGTSPLHAWVGADHKYLHSSLPELYHLPSDASEQHNRLLQELAPAASSALAQAKAALQRLEQLPRLQLADQSSLSAEALESVRSLGYAGAAAELEEFPSLLASSELPDPAGQAETVQRTFAAVLAGGAGQLLSAIRQLEAILQEAPNSVYALERLAAFQLEAERPADALQTLAQLLTRGGERFPTHDLLRQAHEQAGDPAQALIHARRALELLPGDDALGAQLQRLEQAAGTKD
ncbi:MAG: choline-sulfatase [Planctomycetota bacterium]|jgi:choline-sulfatase